MTEQMAIETLKCIKSGTSTILLNGNNTPETEKFLIRDCEALDTAIRTLEEIPRYRDLGTIDELAEMQVQYNHFLHEVKKYRAIGTVEELQALKEKAEPKKPTLGSFGVYRCPTCGEKVGEEITITLRTDCMNYCSYCGTKIDWE